MLAPQGMSSAACCADLGLGILGSVADDSVMVAVMALGSGKLGERGGRLFKPLIRAVLLATGVVLWLQPQWLL